MFFNTEDKIIIMMLVFFLTTANIIHSNKYPQSNIVKNISIPTKLPGHIAIIMDGNRRYGRSKCLGGNGNPLSGHSAGAKTLRRFIKGCVDMNATMSCAENKIHTLTVYAFSSENWGRTASELDCLMNLFMQNANGKLQRECVAGGVRVNIISTDLNRLPDNVRKAMKSLMNATSHCKNLTLNVCLSYGGRAEITSAARALALEVRDGRLDPDDINENTLSRYMLISSNPCSTNYSDTNIIGSMLPITEPDILIRTSGECRLSNFLLWQCAYTELFFIDKMWPEINESDLQKIVNEYALRQRRYGK